ncbi:hypothetical protein X975_13526, partial [Stegodyphus mimosarum]
MVYTYCVPNCKGNYSNDPKVQIFSFPKEKQFLNKWINGISQKQFQANKIFEVNFFLLSLLKGSRKRRTVFGHSKYLNPRDKGFLYGTERA